METKIDLFITVTSFDSSHAIRGKIRFEKGPNIHYSAKRNRTEIVGPILLNKKRFNINSHMPPIMVKKMKEGILDALVSFMEKMKDPAKPEIPPGLKPGSFTERLYKRRGFKMITLHIEEKEAKSLFSKIPQEDTKKKVLPKSFASLACN